MKLIARDIPPRSVWALEQAGIHPLLAQLYAARGVQSAEELDDGLALLIQREGCVHIGVGGKVAVALTHHVGAAAVGQ